VKVVPVFKDVYSGFGAKLPGPTEFLMTLSDLMGHYLWVFLIGWAAMLSMAGCTSSKPRAGANFGTSERIKLPVFGPIAHKICLARFTRTLASLVRSGVPILEVLQIVSQTVGNTVMEKAIKTAASRHRTRRRHSPRWASTRFSQHDHPHDERRRTDRQH
jgi:type IV pilus assembly protein PilC